MLNSGKYRRGSITLFRNESFVEKSLEMDSKKFHPGAPAVVAELLSLLAETKPFNPYNLILTKKNNSGMTKKTICQGVSLLNFNLLLIIRVPFTFIMFLM